MGFYFCDKKKFLKERSLEHFGSSEHRSIPRNKTSKRSFHISVKASVVDEK